MQERRRFARWNINRQASLSLGGGQPEAGCIVQDINLCGVRLAARHALALEHHPGLRINLLNGPSLDVQAMVRWHGRVEDSFVYGLSFSKIHDSEKEKIYQFVNTHFRGEITKHWWKGLSG